MAVPFYLLSGEVLIFYLLCAETGLVVVGAYMWLFLEVKRPPFISLLLPVRSVRLIL